MGKISLDPRIWQLYFQLSFMLIGVVVYDFSLALPQILLTLIAAICAQFFWIKQLKLNHIGIRSALITGCGIALLLRADNLWAHPLAAFLAISSKFTLRLDSKHIWNPAAFGIVLSLLILPGVWVSPGQWGQSTALSVWLIALGMLVTRHAKRDDASWSFLFILLTLLCCYYLWLGYPLEHTFTLLTKQASNGALLLFAFFMISDPMTLPNHQTARVLQVTLVALLVFVWQFIYFQPNSLIFSLVLLAPLTTLWNRIYPAPHYVWAQKTS